MNIVKDTLETVVPLADNVVVAGEVVVEVAVDVVRADVRVVHAHGQHRRPGHIVRLKLVNMDRVSSHPLH